MVLIMIDTDTCFLKICIPAGIDIREFLRITVTQREPAALYLDHEPVAFPERVCHVGQFKPNSFHSAWTEGFRLFKTVPEFSAEDFTSYKHLIPAQRIYSLCFPDRININPLIRKGIRENIYDLDYKISIRRADACA